MVHRSRWPARLAVAGLCLSLLTGCGPAAPAVPETSSPAQPEASAPAAADTVLSLSYNADDTLNPFAAVSRANRELSSLLYEGLTCLDNTLTAQPALAASVTADGSTVTAVLRPDAVFSDGTAVTAADVTASFALAKKSDRYAVLLENVRDAVATREGDAVTFTFGTPDVGYAACLSFPVVRADTITTEPGRAPVGSGLYCFQDNDTLTVNPCAGITPLITTVQLISLSDSSALVHALESGTIGYLFSDLYGGEVPYTTAANTAVDIPYLIFLGINASQSSLADPAVRRALSLAVDRDTLAAEGCSGFARSAVSPFHPAWAGLAAEDLPLLSSTADTAAAREQLSAAGYRTGLSTDKTGAKTLTLSLLINADNPFRTKTAALLEVQLEAAGVSLTVDARPYDDYLAAVKKGSFDLYLGEVRLPADGSLRCFFTAGGGASYGIRTGGTAAKAYAAYIQGDDSLAAFLTAFQQELPFLPLNWQKGMAAFKRSYQQITPSVLDPYYGIGSWVINR